MSDGIALNENVFLMSDQVMVVALVAAVVLGIVVFVAVARPRSLFGRARSGGSSGRKLGLFLGILCATATLVLPVLLCIQEGNALTAIPLLGVRLMQAIVLDNGYVDYIAGLPSGGLATVYYVLIALAYVALPILAALNVYDLIMQNLSRASAAYAVTVSSRGRNVYLFSDFNRNTYGLARDVLACDDRAFVVFAAMSKLERDTWSTEIAKLGSDYVKCFEADYPDMAVKLCSSFKFDQLCCFAISENCDRDVSETCRALGKLRGVRADERGVVCGAFTGADAAGKVARVQLYVTCDSADDQVILDAANGKGERQGAAPPLRLTALNEATMASYLLMEQAPLYKALDQEEVGPIGLRPASMTVLNVLIVGSGRYAEEALKTSLWYGQMHNVSLHVDVASHDAEAMRDRVFQRYPSLRGNALFDLRFTQVSLQSPAFDDVYLARYADCAHAYVIVAVEDDALSYELAMHVRLFFLEHQTVRWADVASHPLIGCLMRDEAMSELVATRFDEDVPGYGLIPFGCSRRLFSYDNMVDSPLERAGQTASDLYDVLWNGLQGSTFSCDAVSVARLREAVAASLETSAASAIGSAAPAGGGIACMPQIRHHSNLSLALHAHYKAWALGYEPGSGELREGKSDLVRSIPVETGVMLGTNEHDRWTVFYQAQGYTGLSFEDQERYSRLLPGKNNRHKIEPFKKHAFVCPNEGIWPNYLHAVGGFSYIDESPLESVGTPVRVRAVADGSADGELVLQLLDGEYRVVETWRADSSWHETVELPDGSYVIHPASALDGRECADDLPFDLLDGFVRIAGAPVDAIEFSAAGKQQVNPVIYDWAFVFAAPFFI